MQLLGFGKIMSTRDLIFEIGTEELPSADIDSAIFALTLDRQGPVKSLFESCNIKYDEAYAYASPRRIILFLKDVPLTQDAVIQGPARRICYDDKGLPTKALESFLQKNNAKANDVEISADEKEPKVFIRKRFVSNSEILKGLLPKIPELIPFSKKMRWNKTGFMFSRPIRWFTVIFGDKILKFQAAGVESSNITRGHRFLGNQNIRIKSAKDFFKALSRNNVLWDNKLREKKIFDFLFKKRFYLNADLVHEAANLVEQPCFAEGVFKKEYLEIPKEVILASMSKHQRIFCLLGKDNKLTNRFVAVLNGNYGNKKKIVKNIENVLEARLKDAMFFYRSDLKKSLSEWAKGLSGFVFHKQIGTMADKALRMKQISEFFSHSLGKEETGTLLRAISLCKTDLLTQMVGEFPSLQGVMGGYYAKMSNETEAVSVAISEHYLPRFSGDDTPCSLLGALCSLCDKLDNIVCYFKIGKFPKGNQDIYALRRQGIGIISILISNKIELSLNGIFDFIYDMAPGNFEKSKLKAIFLDFFKDRFVNYVKTKYGFGYDLILSATEDLDDIYKTYLKLDSLHSIIMEPYFEKARVIVERSHNILKASKGAPKAVDESLFNHEQEKVLFACLKNVRKEFIDLCRQRRYQQATRLYADSIFESLHDFFDKVMVNVDHEQSRVNRLSLLYEINRLYTGNIADLSKFINKNQREEK